MEKKKERKREREKERKKRNPQYHVITYNGKEPKKEQIRICITKSLRSTSETQHCKSNIFTEKKIVKKASKIQSYREKNRKKCRKYM